MNRPVVGYNGLYADAGPSTTPPQWFCERAKFRRILRAAVRAIARDFSIRGAAKARKIDVDFRVVSPPKRAKFQADRARLIDRSRGASRGGASIEEGKDC
jgi:hypothetical protein